ncbi:MAG: hypothetical protein AB1304_07740 [Bacteroidota bacterium]
MPTTHQHTPPHQTRSSIGLPTVPSIPFPNPFLLPGSSTIAPIYFGKKRYELTDWLGNVQVVINDKKTPMGTDSSDMTYAAQVVEVSDYYPFGSPLYGRRWEPVKPLYRFGFNTQEKVNEISPDHYTAKFWEYDARLGRRWNLDPVTKPWESPYSTLSNNPIWFNDVLGDDFINVHTKRKEEAKIERDKSENEFEKAKEGFKPYENMTRKEAKSLGKLKEFKEAKSRLKSAEKQFKKAELIYQNEAKYESIVNQIIEDFKKVNPEKFEEFNKFNPFGRGVIDIMVEVQSDPIKMLDANGIPTGQTTVERVVSKFHSKNKSDDFVKITLQYINVNEITRIQSMTAAFVHGLGHIDKGQRRDETYAIEFSYEQYTKLINKK